MSIVTRRILAALIDHAVILFIVCIPVQIIYDNAKNNIPLYLLFTIGIIAYAALFVCKDLVFKNSGIGKKLVNLVIVKKSGLEKVGYGRIVLRNVILLPLLSLEIILLIFNGERLGDILTNTMVVLKTENE